MTTQTQNKKKTNPETKEKIMEFVRYIIIGVTTTAINWGSSIFFEEVCHMWAWLNSALSWIISIVFFAFWAYKLFVFRSKSMETKILVREFISFCAARLLTLLVEMAIMGIFVDLLGFKNAISFGFTRFEVVNESLTRNILGEFSFKINEFYIAKFFATVVITILNYIFSKVFIFKSPAKADKKSEGNGENSDEIMLDRPIETFEEKADPEN